MERHVLVVLAHPDDESFGLGGTIARFAREGVPVTYVCATRGEMGRRMGKPAFTTREALGALRELEMKDAAAVLGISDLRFLDIWDKTVEFQDPVELAARIRTIIEEIRPSLLYTFHPLYGGHPDHNAIGAATIAAVRQLPADRRPPVRVPLNILAAERHGIATDVVDITDTIEIKKAAIKAHRSQSQGMGELPTFRFADEPEKLEKLKQDLHRERYLDYPV